jgi:hypothetical protein
MLPLSDSESLDLWELGGRKHSLDRALLALAAALPETAPEFLADWPLGRRNRALAALRCSSFGPRMPAWVACARCGEKLEFELDGRVLAEGGRPEDEGVPEPIVVKGRTFRLPTSRDLARAAGADPGRAALALAESCRTDGGGALADDWLSPELEELGERMARLDPMAETRVSLLCPDCGHAWEAAFDLADFLWAEIEARARRLLREIHGLASAYGWTEDEILALRPQRRALYLELVES